MKNHLKPLKAYQSSTGFTLVELLVAVAITGIVITAAGFGLVAILQANRKAEAQTERRIELNRALDYISSDIRSASKVQNASSYNISSPSPACANSTPVVDLTIPGASGKVVYYINDVNGCSNDQTDWLKPGVIKRVTDVKGTTIAGNLGNELIDAVAVPSSPPSCPSGSGTLVGSKGFYTCISSDNRSITLYLFGTLKDSQTTNPGCSIDTSIPVPYYCVTTKVFARSAP